MTPKLPLNPEHRRTLHIAAREGGDWGQDLIHAGLVWWLGPGRVIDWPFHWKYREDHTAFNGDKEHDWGLERRTIGWTPKNHLVSMWSEEEIRDEFRQGNVERIFIDETPESYELYLRLRANFFDIPVVVIAGHDSFQSKLPPWKVGELFGKNLEAMFLDNWQPAYANIPKAHVYNWSINFDHYWERKHFTGDKYDISFQGYNSHPNRARFVDHILSKWGHLKLKLDLERQPNTMRSFIRKSDYFDVMAQSKVCLNLRGAAENGKTLRFYEIPYVGSCMLTQDSGAKQVYPFVNGEHCMYFDDERSLDAAIDHLLDVDGGWRYADIAQRGHEYAMRYHTVVARIQQIYEVLDGPR